MQAILKVENMTKIFHKKGQEDLIAVDNISFELMQGECLAIIGESGSGKSTVVNMITGLLPMTKGAVLLDGQDISGKKVKDFRNVYKKIQMVFQDPQESFDPRLSLGDGIAEGLRNKGLSIKESRNEVIKLLKRCGLSEEFADRYPHEVSGGQCQRAAIARALAVKPEILICDEATSALDVTSQKEIVDLLNELRREEKKKLSILFICHDISLVQQFCDRILVMSKGIIVEAGETQELINRPKNEYTRHLIDSAFFRNFIGKSS